MSVFQNNTHSVNSENHDVNYMIYNNPNDPEMENLLKMTVNMISKLKKQVS